MISLVIVLMVVVGLLAFFSYWAIMHPFKAQNRFFFLDRRDSENEDDA